MRNFHLRLVKLEQQLGPKHSAGCWKCRQWIGLRYVWFRVDGTIVDNQNQTIPAHCPACGRRLLDPFPKAYPIDLLPEES